MPNLERQMFHGWLCFQQFALLYAAAQIPPRHGLVAHVTSWHSLKVNCT